MYLATLEALRMPSSRPGQTADLLSILANHVAKDGDFKGRDDWLRQALDLAKDRIGPNAPVIGELLDVFADSDRFAELVNRGDQLLKAEQYYDAEAIYRAVIKEKSNDANAWMMLGWVLMQQEHFEEATTAFDQTLHCARTDLTLASRVLVVKASASKFLALFQLEKYQAAAAVFLEYVDPDGPTTARSLAASLCSIYGNLLAAVNQLEEAMVAWERCADCVRVDDPSDLRHIATESLNAMGDVLVELDRHEKAATARERVAEYVHMDDPLDLRRVATTSLSVKAEAAAKLNRHEESITAWERVAAYVRVDDPPDLRRTAIAALFGKVRSLSDLIRYRELGKVWLSISDYIRAEDSMDLRQKVATALASGAGLLNVFGEWAEAEAVCRRATHIEPTHYESWGCLAKAILCQGDTTRMTEAEACARRAVELAPDNPGALHTLSDVLACRGNWTEALGMLERALRSGSDFQNREWPGLTGLVDRSRCRGSWAVG